MTLLIVASLIMSYKESFRLPHRACADPYVPRGDTIHPLSACSRCYSSHCLLPNRLACHHIGQSPRDLFSDPLSRQHHRSVLLLADARRSQSSRSLREADKIRSCQFAWNNQSNKRRRIGQPTFERGRRALVHGVLRRWEGKELGWCE